MDTFVVVAHRDDARYLLGDAVGARVWRQRAAAERRAAQMTDEGAKPWAPRGYVVRSLDFVRCEGAAITPTGRVRLTTPCECHVGDGALPTCPYHNLHRA